MILTDAGPLVALLDADEEDHERCRDVLDRLTLPMLTSWPAFTEAVYLMGRSSGWPGQEPLMRLVLRGDLVVADLDAADLERVAELMAKYADRPMDLADASLVVLAERHDLREVFTLDSDFHVYRLRNRRALHVVPAEPSG